MAKISRLYRITGGRLRIFLKLNMHCNIPTDALYFDMEITFEVTFPFPRYSGSVWFISLLLFDFPLEQST